ncbi:MAG: MATE family efflux transporter [Lutibacter sp.]|nr:MATE family efflux transporter [Lutibacter sp.]
MGIKNFIKTLSERGKSYLTRDNELSQTILRNVIMSFGVRGGSIIVGLLIVPLTLDYVSAVDYGIWLTISSIVSWLSFFDIGLGNGLRNKLSEANAKKKNEDAKIYISTTYAAIASIALLLLIIFYFANKVINWQDFLNITNLNNETLQLLFLLVVSSFCVQFVIKIINSILTALHFSALSGFITFLGQLGVLIGIFILKSFAESNLIYLFLVLTIVPIVILSIATILLFRKKLNYLKPNFKFIRFGHLKSVLNLGGAFFIVQIGALVLFQTDNFIISRVLGPESVTEFNIAFKLFSLTTMVTFIILTPYWSAYSDAWARKDFNWMRKNLVLIRKIWVLLSIITVLLYFVAPFLYKVWIGDTIKISNNVSFAMMIYSIVISFQASHNYVINGLGKIKIQMYLMVISAVLNIPLAFYLGGIYGIQGIIYSNVFFMLILGVVFYFQLNNILLKS